MNKYSSLTLYIDFRNFQNVQSLYQTLGKKPVSTEKQQQKERNRILICAPSNAAIDEIVKRLLNSPPKLLPAPASTTNASNSNASINATKRNCGDFNLLRVGFNVEAALRHCTLEYLVDQKMKSMQFKHNPDAIQKEIKKLNQILDALDKSCVKLKMSADPNNKHEKVCLICYREEKQFIRKLSFEVSSRC